MNNINYPIVTGLTAENELRNIEVQSEQFGLTSNRLNRRQLSTVHYAKFRGKIKLALGMIYFFSLMYFTFILMT